MNMNIDKETAEDELSKRKEEWRRMIAHDLRAPLSNILAVLQVIHEVAGARALEAKELELLNISIRSGKRMTELLDLFLDIAKLDEGVMPVDKKEIPLFPMLQSVIEDEIEFSQAKNISIKIGVKKGETVLADKRLLERILQNLLNNALKFTPRGGIISISADLSNPKTSLISVKDNGIGIPAEGMATLFDRFHQAQARREGLIQGNGLGLAFCQEAVKAMGGNISVRSELGQGSEFTVSLPRF